MGPTPTSAGALDHFLHKGGALRASRVCIERRKEVAHAFLVALDLVARPNTRSGSPFRASALRSPGGPSPDRHLKGDENPRI